jgi:hypothetical protein
MHFAGGYCLLNPALYTTIFYLNASESVKQQEDESKVFEEFNT